VDGAGAVLGQRGVTEGLQHRWSMLRKSARNSGVLGRPFRATGRPNHHGRMTAAARAGLLRYIEDRHLPGGRLTTSETDPCSLFLQGAHLRRLVPRFAVLVGGCLLRRCHSRFIRVLRHLLLLHIADRVPVSLFTPMQALSLTSDLSQRRRTIAPHPPSRPTSRLASLSHLSLRPSNGRLGSLHLPRPEARRPA
jgi:hypothetical protein